MSARAVGYSGTPLAKKLGLKAGCRILVRNPPDVYARLLEPLPPRVVFVSNLSESTDIVHLFSSTKRELHEQVRQARKGMRQDAVIWVSWPKKASRVPTDITEDTVRDIALPMGLVDVKVCAVSEVWSGLKLVIRTELR